MWRATTDEVVARRVGREVREDFDFSQTKGYAVVCRYVYPFHLCCTSCCVAALDYSAIASPSLLILLLEVVGQWSLERNNEQIDFNSLDVSLFRKDTFYLLHVSGGKLF